MFRQDIIDKRLSRVFPAFLFETIRHNPSLKFGAFNARLINERLYLTKGMIMIGYVTVGTNDLARSAEFYDALFSEIGAKRIFDTEQFIAWGTDPDACAFSITKPFDGNAATVGNGVMIAFSVKNPEQVDAMYKKAMELGATDEGAAGPRGEGFYAGYFRDFDGNKMNFYCMT